MFELFGYLSVVLHGLGLVAQSVLLGSVSFLLLIAIPVARDSAQIFVTRTRRLIRAAALATIVATLATTAVNGAVLALSLDVSWRDIVGADFAIAGAVKASAAAAIALLMLPRPRETRAVAALIVILSGIILYEAVATTHSAARLRDADALLVATSLHELGAAVWLGGLPGLWIALKDAPTPQTAHEIGRRFSSVAIAGVGLIGIGAIVFAMMYIGSVHAAYGTAYGMMSVAKSVLFAMLLSLGLANFLSVRRFAIDAAAVQRVRCFVEVEMGIGFAVLMAAASITSMPPAVDLALDRVTLSELAARLMPGVPQMQSPNHTMLGIPALQARLDQEWRRAQASNRPQAFVPGSGALPPRNAFDIAWSEYNHHWAGLVVLMMGLAALAHRSGRMPWAQHWPLLFIALAAFLFFRADPEVWPMGEIGVVESLKDPEVVQHRMFVLLIIAFALFEWRIRTGRIQSRRWMCVFPLLTAIGGTLLLTHSHALGNVKEEVLVEATHLPIAVLGIVAGWARWLEVESPDRNLRWTGWVWPACFICIALLLVFYREA